MSMQSPACLDETKGDAVRRILVFRGGALGDVILTLPVFGALRLAFPNAHIEVVGDTRRILLARHSAYANAIMDAERLEIYRLFSREARKPQKLVSYLSGFDLILSYVPAPSEVFIDNIQRCCPGDVIAWTSRPDGTVHATDHLLQPVLGLIGTTPSAEPRVYPDTEGRQAANRFWQSTGLPDQGVLAIHAGSGGPHKLWPQEGWQQIMNWAAKDGVPGILICGPAAQERGLGSLLNNLSPGWEPLCSVSLLELASILEKCVACAGHDSGVTHLAAAVGIPNLALFGPTDPRVWGPRGHRTCVMQPDLPGPLGLDNMPAATVIETLRAVLDGTFEWNPSRLGHTHLRVLS